MKSAKPSFPMDRISAFPNLDLVKWCSWFTTLTAASGILLLLSQSQAFAQDEMEDMVPPPQGTPGFESGPKPFNNPFAGQQTPPGDFFEEEEEEEFDFPPPSRPDSGRAGFSARPSSGGSGMSGNAPISMGGTSQAASNRSTVSSIQVDSETGEGSKEVVTDFNFPDADILDIAKTLGKLTGKNFILDKDVKGRITIISNSPITVGDAWKAFLTALDMNGFALIPSGKYIRIARSRDARDKQLRTYTGEYSPDTDALITRLFPLKYLSAEEVARNFRSFMPANSRIIPYEQTNTVIVTDTGSNISKLDRLLQILDIEGYDAGIEVISVKYASATELSKLIDTLVPGTARSGAAGGSRFAGKGGNFSARRTKEGGIINTIIADERTNSLIVHANSKGASQVRDLVNQLDQKIPAARGGRVHVVYLQFAESEQVASTLNNLSSSAGGRTSAVGGAAGGTGINPNQTSLFEGAIKVSPDKSTNSLVITASPSDFDTIQRVIHKLDIPRDQVYAEIVIMEVALNRDFQYSANIVRPTSSISAITSLPTTDFLDLISSPISSKGAVLSWGTKSTTNMRIGGVDFAVPNLAALLKILQTNSNANVLATPQILTLDNKEATFETAEKIPVPTTTAIQGSVATSVSKENVSLTITIKPQINKMTNFVTLDIQAKMADISGREPPAQVKDIAFATIERSAKTSVVVADNDTVVLGGLMRDNQTEQVSKVPILGDIPILGWLFKSRKTQTVKTNLVMFITPSIVRQYEKMRAILDKKLAERDAFIEENTGGQDPNRSYRNELIRNLPNMEDITSYKPQNVATIRAGEEEEEENNQETPPSAPANEARPGESQQ